MKLKYFTCLNTENARFDTRKRPVRKLKEMFFRYRNFVEADAFVHVGDRVVT